MVPQNLSKNDELFLAAIPQRDYTNQGLYVQVFLPAEPLGSDYPLTRLDFPARLDETERSNRAVRWSLRFVNANKPTTLYFSLPFSPDLELENYPRLELQYLPRADNPAFARLAAFTSRLRAI